MSEDLDPIDVARPLNDDQALALALDWAARGVPAFPVAISWDATKYDGAGGTNKRPLTNRGHLSAVTDETSLRRLFTAAASRLQDGEEWGVGLWPGPAGRIVVDVDDKGAMRGSDELAALEAADGPLPEHPIVLTPSGGTHRWFAKPTEVKVGNVDLAPGVEIRADDGWVVAPGTVTSWGAWEAEESTLMPAPPWPDWLAARLSRPGQPAPGETGGRWRPLEDVDLHPADRAALKALEDLGGHSAHLGRDGEIRVTRPGKLSGVSATVGYTAPGVVRVWSDGWEGLAKGWYALDDDGRLAPDSRDVTVLAAPSGDRTSGTLAVRLASEVTPKPVRWLWDQRLAYAKLNVLGGPPGVGKSYLTCALAASVSRGKRLPGDLRAPTDPQRVVMLSFEDDPEDTLRPRLEALGADLDRVDLVEGIDADGKRRAFGPDDVAVLATHLAARGDVGLVVIDPVSAFVGAGTDEHRGNEVRAALEELRVLAQGKGFAAVLIMHTRKSTADTALNRLSGSQAYGALVRSAMMAGPIPDDERGQHALAHVKHNLSAKQPTLAYSVDADGLHWHGEIDLDGEEVAGNSDGADRSAGEEARAFLRELLADGRAPSKEVLAQADAEGIATNTLKRAKKALGIESVKDGDGWYWLPPTSPRDPTGPGVTRGTLGSLAPESDGARTPERAPATLPLAEGGCGCACHDGAYHHLGGSCPECEREGAA